MPTETEVAPEPWDPWDYWEHVARSILARHLPETGHLTTPEGYPLCEQGNP